MSETNYEKALNQALEEALASLREKDLKETAFRSGASCEGDGRLKISLLNRAADVDLHQGRIMIHGSPADIRVSVLILHYLLRASGSPLTGQMIGFKEIPQGALYFQPFRNRVYLPVLRILEKDQAGFEACAEKIGGERLQAGDLCFRFKVFPYVTAQYVWHQGEEGIPPDLNILFDASIPEYLSTEDVVVMCEEINRTMKSVNL
ncbi:MAG: DUF3786 domain-containing protein [bacterium]